MFRMRFLRLLCVGLTLTTCLSLPQALAQDPNDPSPEALATIAEQLDVIAGQLSQKLLADDLTRDLIWAETQVAPSPEHKLDLREIANIVHDPSEEAADPVWNNILGAMGAVDVALAGPPEEAGGSIPALTDFSLYFPVEEHRRKWDGGANLLVVSAPVDDNDVTAQIIAYSVADQSTVELDRDIPPETPTLVIGLREPDPEEENPPLPSIETSGVGLMSSSAIRLGLPLVLIRNKSEGWLRGDPEIYVKIHQWINGVKLKTKKRNLGYVNQPHRWYWVGDPGALYFPFTSSYGNVIKFVFKEADWPDSDDHMGTLYVYRDQLGLCSDYRLYSHHYMRVFADID